MSTTYASSDAVQAYLFECDDAFLFAISLDPTGSNIPSNYSLTGWELVTKFALGVQEPMPVAIEPEPVIAAMRTRGYYVWRQGTKR